MSISFNNALGIHEQALSFRSQRAAVLANNLANADTPHYKARDLDFAAALEAAQAAAVNQPFSMAQTQMRHLAGTGLTDTNPALRYRTPHHPSIDQNTVDAELEQAEYAKNSVDFQASFTFLNNKFKGIMNALRGE
ncbi:flagellar basal-body rod protein FlgB [Azomonas agilis]|uniref:Flagellar basal body rod protein FlgB n=1 Tax=Azomonas agilis TaxID=116849 RepID=A0A562I1S9_9GAMM|nr:flagellar basal body rod protein FlgB [Azomonas agilis]TWH64991.1 flagellar basal-body rod protein FlgB [Azomonas agilis]